MTTQKAEELDRNSEEYLAMLPAHLDTLKEKIRQILLHIPSSRSSDKILYLEVLKCHTDYFCYDPSTKLISFVNHEGITYENWLMLPNLESVGRLRRYLQKEARERIKSGMASEEDAELLPSDKVAEQRRLREEENRLYYLAGA